MPRHNAPLFLRSAAHVPRRPAPPSLLRSTRVILDANAADTNDRRITCYACNNVCRPWEIWKENRRKEERRKRRRREKARERKHGGRKRRGCRNRNRNRPTFTFTSLCRLFHSFHSRISLSRPRPWPRDSRRDRSTIAPAASFLLSPPSRLGARPSLSTRPTEKK